jgi:hypothetical protein
MALLHQPHPSKSHQSNQKMHGLIPLLRSISGVRLQSPTAEEKLTESRRHHYNPHSINASSHPKHNPPRRCFPRRQNNQRSPNLHRLPHLPRSRSIRAIWNNGQSIGNSNTPDSNPTLCPLRLPCTYSSIRGRRSR